jgi:hypothetical protein
MQKMPRPPWTVKRSGDLITVDVPADGKGWEQWLMFRSDAHEDSLGADREKIARHLEDAKTRNAMIFDGGDIFDAMQGFHDKRSEYGSDGLRDELNGPDYYDRCVDDLHKRLKPYAHLFVEIDEGNHEASVRRHSNTDLIARLVARMRSDGSQVIKGGYREYTQLRFKRAGKVHTKTIYRHHGSGGGAPVTRGMIKTSRRAAYIRDADLVTSGHDHNSYLTPHQRETVDGNKLGRHTQWHISVPSYKDDLLYHANDYVMHREFAPQWTGCIWLRWHFDNNDQLRMDLIYAE